VKRLILLVAFMLVMLAQSVPASAQMPWFRPWDIPREWLEYCSPYTVWKDYYTGEIYCTEYIDPHTYIYEE
jgi:hypothetical protein